MSIRTKISAAAVAVALSVTPAFAEVLDFTWIISAGDVATWSQSSDPTPVSQDGGSTSVGVNNGMSSSGPFSVVKYFASSVGGGLAVNGLGDVHGVQIYTGSEDAPMFAPGKFSTRTGSVTITAALPAIPEPSIWAMMLIGFASLGYAAMRRNGVVRPISA
jgi:hypothetical protein